MARYAISDIHGCARTFAALLSKIGLNQSDELFLLGDYIDRGPDSKGVLDLIFSLKKEGYNIICLRGNHEQMLLDALDKRGSGVFYGIHRDEAMLNSFGVQWASAIPESYITWMRETIFYVETDGYILVHAGLNFKSPDPLTDTYSMIWIRNWYRQISKKWLRGRTIVHGHTPIPQDQIRRQLANLGETPALDIDAGCNFIGEAGYGTLCAFDLERRMLFFQENVEND